MKNSLLFTLLIACALFASNFFTEFIFAQNTSDTLNGGSVHPIIEKLFYGLPLKLSRLDLRDVMMHDQRFVSTDSTFNGYPPATFFKGITKEKGQIESNPDSIQVMLVYGNASLVTVKGGQTDSSKHPVILNVKYFFSSKAQAVAEYGRISRLIAPLYSDSSDILENTWEADYSKGKQKGIQRSIGKIYDHFNPYYRLSISTVSFEPMDKSAAEYVLEIAFSKVDR